MAMFSDRTCWDLSVNRFTILSEKIKASGSPIYDLTVSNPTQCGFAYFQEKLLASFFNASNLKYQADPRGLELARRAVADYYAGYGIEVPITNIFLTASTSEAYGFLFRLLANPYDEVVFPKPSYPLFDFLAGIHDLHAKTYRLVYHDRWALDQEAFQASLDGVKAIILVNPNNPTGSCLSSEEIQFVVHESARRQIPMICDEVFLDYSFSHSALTSLAGNQENLTFVLGGVSKLLALPQMKCSWIVINGPQEMVDEAAARLEVIADTYLSVNTPVQHALGDWMKLRPDIQAQVLERVCKNRVFLEDIIRQKEGCGTLLKADGGWAAVCYCPQIDDEESFVLDLLESGQVCVHPGYFFDFLETGYIIFSLLPQEDIFQEGVRRVFKKIHKM